MTNKRPKPILPTKPTSWLIPQDVNSPYYDSSPDPLTGLTPLWAHREIIAEIQQYGRDKPNGKDDEICAHAFIKTLPTSSSKLTGKHGNLYQVFSAIQDFKDTITPEATQAIQKATNYFNFINATRSIKAAQDKDGQGLESGGAFPGPSMEEGNIGVTAQNAYDFLLAAWVDARRDAYGLTSIKPY